MAGQANVMNAVRNAEKGNMLSQQLESSEAVASRRQAIKLSVEKTSASDDQFEGPAQEMRAVDEQEKPLPTPRISSNDSDSSTEPISIEARSTTVEGSQTTVINVTADGKIPSEVLHLIEGKSPDEVINIINGQLAELKAVEALRDVEEECLDDLTNEIIAKLTKESSV